MTSTATPAITADTEITESDTRATRLQVLEAQVCEARDDLAYAQACADPGYAIRGMKTLATVLQHTLQELAQETGPR